MAGEFINPKEQYLNIAGSAAAVRSKFTYLESGTDDAKAVFTDTGLSVSTSNVQETDSRGELPRLFFAGNARITRYDLINGKLILRWDLDPVEGIGSATSFQQWSSEVVYSIGDIVQASDGELYKSLTDNNINNDPSGGSDNLNWDTIIPSSVTSAITVFSYNNFGSFN